MGLGDDRGRAIDNRVHHRVHLRQQFKSGSGSKSGIITRSELIDTITFS
jgi:hypothetical protein